MSILHAFLVCLALANGAGQVAFGSHAMGHAAPAESPSQDAAFWKAMLEYERQHDYYMKHADYHNLLRRWWDIQYLTEYNPLADPPRPWSENQGPPKAKTKNRSKP